MVTKRHFLREFAAANAFVLVYYVVLRTVPSCHHRPYFDTQCAASNSDIITRSFCCFAGSGLTVILVALFRWQTSRGEGVLKFLGKPKAAVKSDLTQ